MLTTLPLVATVCAVKLALHAAFDFTGVVDFGDVGVVLTGAVFLIGFMLSGVMADYKESEKLPGELACALENVEDALTTGARMRGLPADAPRRAVLALVEAIRAWLYRTLPTVELHAQLAATLAALEQLDGAGAAAAARAQSELWSVRRTLTRIEVIRETTFLKSGYALLDTLVILAVVVVAVARFKSTLGEVILVPVVTLIFVYMVRLIRDVDDPFDHDASGRSGAAEVDLFPLRDYELRLRARIGDDRRPDSTRPEST
jgi:hypothetical protein